MLLLKTAVILGMIIGYHKVESCQPELVEDAAELITIGYDRPGRTGKTALYVDTISVEMKDKKKFRDLLTSSCNRRGVASVKIDIRKHGSQEWENIAKDIRITSKHFDDIRNLDPCSIYEVRVSIVPKKGESIILPVVPVGPYYELEPEDISIAKFKSDGDGDHYFKEHFKPNYTKVTDNSFTVQWQPICAKGISVWVRDVDLEEEDGTEKQIKNDIENPTTEVTFDVQHCKNFDVIFEFFLDSEVISDHGYTYDLELLTTDPNKMELKKKFMEHTYDNSSKTLDWDYTKLIDEFDCLDSFSYKLVKDENGDIEDLKDGNFEDSNADKYDVSTIKSECNFGLRTEIEYKTVQGHEDYVNGFELHIKKKDQKDNSIAVKNSSILFEVNPCGAERDAEIVIGLAEVEREGRGIHGRMLESSLTGQVSVDKSMTDIKRSEFDENELKSCVAYKIMLLRRSNNDFKELETADFENPKWNTWKAPTLQGTGHEKSITFNLTDNETGGECSVRHYNINCTKEGEEDTKEKIFQPNEKLLFEDLSPETKYMCKGRIVHTIPGGGELETPLSDIVEVQTVESAPEPSLPPKRETAIETGSQQEPVVGEKSAGLQSGGYLSNIFLFVFIIILKSF